MDTQERVTVIGASGLIGKAITSALLTKGKYHVNAAMRNPGAFGINHAFVKLYQADVLNQEQVEAALEGSFAAVISVARDIKSDQNLLTEYAGVITKALKAKGVQRVIVIAGAGAIPSGEGKYHVESPHFPPQYVNICHDHLSALKIYEAAGFQLTVLCPPDVQERAFTGKYEVAGDALVLPNNKWVVGNGEIGDFVVKELQNPQFIGKRVNITDTD